MHYVAVILYLPDACSVIKHVAARTITTVSAESAILQSVNKK